MDQTSCGSGFDLENFHMPTLSASSVSSLWGCEDDVPATEVDEQEDGISQGKQYSSFYMRDGLVTFEVRRTVP
jgi:hypothetical protein